jgi:phage-related tail fiber protein
MSYQSASQLIADTAFNGRTRACCNQQAQTFKDDTRASFVALADAVLRNEGDPLWAFVNINANGPGIADKADDGAGGVDQAKVTDADLLSLTQANWQVVAGLYFDDDGNPT